MRILESGDLQAHDFVQLHCSGAITEWDANTVIQLPKIELCFEVAVLYKTTADYRTTG
jgi:hypothetical protein